MTYFKAKKQKYMSENFGKYYGKFDLGSGENELQSVDLQYCQLCGGFRHVPTE